MRRFIARTVRATAIVARDEQIPRPLRYLALLGLLPVPGPFDEAVLLIAAVPLFVFYRGRMREAWQSACASATAPT